MYTKEGIKCNKRVEIHRRNQLVQRYQLNPSIMVYYYVHTYFTNNSKASLPLASLLPLTSQEIASQGYTYMYIVLWNLLSSIGLIMGVTVLHYMNISIILCTGTHYCIPLIT